MYQIVSVHIDPDDGIRAVTDQPGFVSILVDPPTGGPLALIFAPTDGPASAIGVIDKLMAALGEARESLVVRHLSTAGLAAMTELEGRTQDGDR